MKTGTAALNFVRNQQGFIALALVTLALTAVIGGATILAMVTSRRPVSGAMDRLDKNQATPADMDTLQNAGKDMERTMRIAAGGGSFIGGGGPVPNPASPVGAGSFFPGDKAVAGIIPRVISRVTARASQPAQRGSNPMPGESGGTGNRAAGSGEYNPLNDPNVSGAGSTDSGQNLDDVNRFGSDFQAQQLGGTAGSGRQTSGQQGQTTVQQPGSYTTPGTYGRDSTSPDQQGGGYYPPYGAASDSEGRGSDWTRWASEPERRSGRGERPQSGGSTGSTQQGPAPAGSKGIEVTEVGTAPPGKCRIISGQLVPVQGYKENISGMTVTLTGPVNVTATSSAAGAFSFTDIPAGDYVISVNQWNYGMTRQNFTAPSGKSVRIVLKGSCPFLYVWTGERYERENDIYSVARMMPQELVAPEKTAAATDPDLVLVETALDSAADKVGRGRFYKDFYTVSKRMRPDKDGNYRAQIIEQAGEHSFTDHVAVLAIDHLPGLRASMTREGKAILYNGVQPSGPFHDLKGNPLVADRKVNSTAHSMEGLHQGQELYNADGVEISLPEKAFRLGVLLVTWQGFRDGSPAHHTAASGRPMLALQRQASDGEWKTVDWVYPRDEVQQSAFVLDMKDGGWDRDRKVRLISTSCAEEKFHRIDRVEWAVGADEIPSVRSFPLLTALQGDAKDVKDKLSASDNSFLHLGPEEHVTLIFRGEPVAGGLERSLFFVSEGFYIPMPYIRVAAE